MSNLKDCHEDRGEVDNLYQAAVSIVMETGNVSVALLQRRLDISYSTAGQFVDQMESAGLVGPYVGSKSRDVLVNREAWLTEHPKKDRTGCESSLRVTNNCRDLMSSIVRPFEKTALAGGLEQRVLGIESGGSCYVLEVKLGAEEVLEKFQVVSRDFSVAAGLKLISIIEGKASYFVVLSS